jgi:glycosyltransferase-like protein
MRAEGERRMIRPLRIAILAHSTNPRGGVVHALALGDALTRLGHKAVVHAPDATGHGFFRASHCGAVSVPVSPVSGGMRELVEARVADYVRFFEHPEHRQFDVFHCHDGISGNALATLKARGLIGSFARTVHHIDTFADERLAELQDRSIRMADRHFVVSQLWQETLATDHGIDADIVGNGVDLAQFTPVAEERDDRLRAELHVGQGPVFLAVGGIEERKNTVRILQAFAEVYAIHPHARLLIAGGVSLLDHKEYRAQFNAARAQTMIPPSAIVELGRIAQEDMAALYRIADVLVCPSLKEGFGLVVLEAMACGTPVVVSAIPPFTEYLSDNEAMWCDPTHAGSIANAMIAALNGPLRQRLIKRGYAAACRHDWERTASLHIPGYQAVRVMEHA